MPGVPWIRLPPTVEEAETESPGDRRAVPDAADPGTIRPPGPVHDHVIARHIGADVARRVADINHLGSGIVHAHVSHVVQRRTARNGIDHRRYVTRYRPRSERRRGDEPDAIVERVEGFFADPNHGHRRVDRVLQGRAFDRLEHRTAVVANFQMSRAARHRRHLRHGIRDYRFARLRRPRHSGPHTLGRMLGGNHGEVTGKAGDRHEIPLPLFQRCRAIPPAGDQRVVVLRLQIKKQLVGGIGHVEQLRALNRGVLRRPVSLQQFGRHRTDDNGHGSGRHGTLPAIRLKQVHLILLDRDLFRLLQLRGRIQGNGPRTIQAPRLHPAVGHKQEVA